MTLSEFLRMTAQYPRSAEIVMPDLVAQRKLGL